MANIAGWLKDEARCCSGHRTSLKARLGFPRFGRGSEVLLMRALSSSVNIRCLLNTTALAQANILALLRMRFGSHGRQHAWRHR